MPVVARGHMANDFTVAQDRLIVKQQRLRIIQPELQQATPEIVFLLSSARYRGQ
jgi:hypothetical protein